MAERDRPERTDQLETTIHKIEALQQTGILEVERAKGGVREKATLVFLYGRAVEATVGSRTGQDAMDWVITWGSCRYIFENRLPSEIVPQISLPASTVDEENVPASPLAFFAQVVQKYTQGATENRRITEEIISEIPIDQSPTTPMLVPAIIPPARPLQTPLPSTPSLATDWERPRIPIRLLNDVEVMDSMEKFGLARLHRRVFFLLDGRRNAIDLVRLTGRPFYEIQTSLAELERLGLIRMDHATIGENINND